MYFKLTQNPASRLPECWGDSHVPGGRTQAVQCRILSLTYPLSWSPKELLLNPQGSHSNIPSPQKEPCLFIPLLEMELKFSTTILEMSKDWHFSSEYRAPTLPQPPLP